MSDIDTTEGTETEEPEHIRNLREQAKEGAKARAELAQIRRERAMEKAGIPVDSKVGAAFAKQYDGDLSDLEALKAEAREWGLVKDETTETEQTETTTETNEPTGTDERRAMASGATAEGPTGADPRKAALDRAKEIQDRGGTQEQAGAAFMASLAEAALAGDDRVLVKGRMESR